MDAPRPAPAEATAHGCHRSFASNTGAPSGPGDVNSGRQTGPPAAAANVANAASASSCAAADATDPHSSACSRNVERRRSVSRSAATIAASTASRSSPEKAPSTTERSRGADALEVFPRSTRAPDPTRGHSMASAHATRDASAASLTRARRPRDDASARTRRRARAEIPYRRHRVSLAATIAAASAATRRVCLAAERFGGSARASDADAADAARARPTHRSRSGARRSARRNRPAASSASAASSPPDVPPNAATASCRSATRAGSRSGAAIQRRRVLDPAAVQHASTRERRLPSARPSAVTRSSRSRSVGPSNRTRSSAYTACAVASAAASADAHLRRSRCVASAAVAARAAGRASRTAEERNAETRSTRPDRPDPVYPSFVSSARSSRDAPPSHATASASSASSAAAPSSGNSVLGASATTRGAEGVFARATRAAALTPPRRVTTSAGAVRDRSVARLAREASSPKEPTRSRPAAASKKANPTVASPSAARFADSSPDSSPDSSTNARTCVASGAIFPAPPARSPSTTVTGVMTPANSLRMTAVLLPVLALASAAVSICSTRPTR